MFSAALYARVRTFLCTLHTRSRVQRASGIPCSLVFGRAKISSNHSGAMRREIVDLRLMPDTVIASEAKQSIARRQERMDCFVASLLAMTKGQISPLPQNHIRAD